jgi:predicted O-methyltransferase YrrM
MKEKILNFYLTGLNKNKKSELVKLYEEIIAFQKMHYIPAVSLDVALFLNWLSNMRQPKSILEIGFGSGVSGSFILKGAESCMDFISLEHDNNRFVRGNELLKKFDMEKIKLLKIDAFDFLNECNGKFDFIFLDAAKNDYIKYLEVIHEYINPNGVFVCDNILFGNKVLENEVEKKYQKLSENMKLFNQRLSENEFFDTFFLNIGDGISISVKGEK